MFHWTGFRLIILPKQFMEHPAGDNTKMIGSLAAAGVEWKTYEWQANRRRLTFIARSTGLYGGISTNGAVCD